MKNIRYNLQNNQILIALGALALLGGVYAAFQYQSFKEMVLSQNRSKLSILTVVCLLKEIKRRMLQMLAKTSEKVRITRKNSQEDSRTQNMNNHSRFGAQLLQQMENIENTVLKENGVKMCDFQAAMDKYSSQDEVELLSHTILELMDSALQGEEDIVNVSEEVKSRLDEQTVITAFKGVLKIQAKEINEAFKKNQSIKSSNNGQRETEKKNKSTTDIFQRVPDLPQLDKQKSDFLLNSGFEQSPPQILRKNTDQGIEKQLNGQQLEEDNLGEDSPSYLLEKLVLNYKQSSKGFAAEIDEVQSAFDQIKANITQGKATNEDEIERALQ